MPSVISPDWDFSKMGIGGLDEVKYFFTQSKIIVFSLFIYFKLAD